MGWGNIVSRAGKNYTKYVESNAISVKSTDFWHRLNATRQIKCTTVHYVAFNLPIVAFTLSGDQLFVKIFTILIASDSNRPQAETSMGREGHKTLPAHHLAKEATLRLESICYRCRYQV